MTTPLRGHGREIYPPAARFARAVRALRREAGLTQADLAAQVGLSAEAISKIERGMNGHMRLGTALRLAAWARDLTGHTLEDLTTPDPDGRW